MPYFDKSRYFHPEHGAIGGKPPSDPKELEYWLWRCRGGNKSRGNAQINDKDNSLSLCHRPVPRTINGVIKIGKNLTVQHHEESAEIAKPKLNPKQNSKPCPYCSLFLNPKYLDRHIYKQHRELEISLKNKANFKPNIKSLSNSQSQAQSQVLSCPYCAASVSQKRFKKHIKRVHPDQQYINTLESSNCADWYDCNTVDPIDGSKYLGFERREYEDSRFGSFPLHDDYGEESWAD